MRGIIDRRKKKKTKIRNNSYQESKLLAYNSLLLPADNNILAMAAVAAYNA
jgi:hypothetical protein